MNALLRSGSRGGGKGAPKRKGNLNINKSTRVGVLLGGISEEREISLRTGEAIASALKAKGYKVFAIDAGRDLAQRLCKEAIEVAFIALHGRYGEDGCVQGLLEVMGIPYTGSGVLASSTAMNKVAAKKVFIFHAVSTPSFTMVRKGGAVAGPGVPVYPVVVKPACQGSAIGVSIVKNKAALGAALKKARAFDGEILIEEFIKGRELTVAVLDGAALPVIEIRPRTGFYDYAAKYTAGMTEFVVPARLKKKEQDAVVGEALRAYRALTCAGAARVDIMLGEDGTPFVLEVNTIPGMTELSLFPKAALVAGLDYPALAEKMLKGAGLNKF